MPELKCLEKKEKDETKLSTLIQKMVFDGPNGN